MRVVLLEATNACEAGQCALRLVAVEHAKVSEANRQLLVRALAVLEHKAVGWAVHRLEGPRLVLSFKRKHVILVVLPVTGCFPEFCVKNVWGDDLLEPAHTVLLTDKVHEAVVQEGTLGKEEGTAGAELVEEEQVLLNPEPAVVALRSELLHLFPLREELLVGE